MRSRDLIFMIVGIFLIIFIPILIDIIWDIPFWIYLIIWIPVGIFGLVLFLIKRASQLKEEQLKEEEEGKKEAIELDEAVRRITLFEKEDNNDPDELIVNKKRVIHSGKTNTPIAIIEGIRYWDDIIITYIMNLINPKKYDRIPEEQEEATLLSLAEKIAESPKKSKKRIWRKLHEETKEPTEEVETEEPEEEIEKKEEAEKEEAEKPM